ncbi:nuclear pore complex subunit Nup159 [Akanthomyces lecanii RCEF 1005]|uniref:Nuclear pore complex subunit Nup159 n=1 Tax=Akanthomyces lecanii RCEF 1005 TaxID=1081108 RepID=A0A168HRM4_CORDF|nr:nuclear pore complex subunit Nup159 [Akanthomyces lecanii RCEF 1005]
MLFIQALGFQSIAGDAKVRLTSPWPEQPPRTASLLSIASKRGLAAAVGPDYITFASTESIRKAFESPKEGDSDVRSYEPQLKIQMPMRISQVAFTADENYLLLSAESGGGLAVYEVQSLLQGSTNSAFELPTNGQALRVLAPNPTAEKAELCALVTDSGELFMANLRERQVSNVLKSRVSCISWSAKGKQLCAGLADGSIHQITPEGQDKAEIPKPPSLGDCHVTSLTWLENNLFLAVHSGSDSQPASIYHIITREPPSSFKFQRIADPVEPFSDKRPHHSILRLRNFDPDLQDLLMVSSTASTDVGLLTRSKKALANDWQAGQVTGIFTTTELLDDTRRPTLPMTESMDDSVPVGVCLDLSSKEKVYRPLPSDEEVNESPSPLPGLWVLTHEGILCAWWFVYEDSIKQGTTYSGLAVASDSATMPPPAQPASTTPAASPFAPGKLSATFGSPAPAAPAFGSSSSLGQKSSPWASGGAATATPSQTGGATFSQTSFGNAPSTPAPAFGKPSSLGFGQSSQLGMRTSPWSAGGNSTPAFGQSSFGSFANKNNQSPFGTAAISNDNESSSTSTTAGGFSGFAKNTGGFAAASNNSPGTSVFGSGAAKPTSNPFASAAPSAESPFTPKDKAGGSVFGSTPFKLESSFKPDPSAKDDSNTPTASGSMFGSAFGSALTGAGNGADSSNVIAKDESMAEDDAEPQAPEPPKSIFGTKTAEESTTPTTTPAPNRFGAATSPAPGTSLFGQPTKLSSPFSGGSLFGSNNDSNEPKAASGFFSQTSAVPKTEPPVEKELEAPLPPDATSKLSYPLGESSSSSASTSSTSQLFGFTPPAKAKQEESSLPPFSLTSKPAQPVEDKTVQEKSAEGKSTEDKSATDAPLPPFTMAPKDAKSAEPAPLPPFTAPKTTKPADGEAPFPPFTLGQTTKPAEAAPSPPFGAAKTTKSAEEAPLPPFAAPKSAKPAESAPLPPFTLAPQKADSALPSGEMSVFKSTRPSGPTPAFVAPTGPPPSDSDDSDDDDGEEGSEGEAEGEEDEGEEDDAESEGSGVDVAKDLSPSTTGLVQTPGLTPQSSFGGMTSTTPATARPEHNAGRPLFGEVARTAPLFGKPKNDASPRSPSPLRGAIPNRVIRSEASRSVSAPGMASQILGHKSTQSHLNQSITSRQQESSDPFLSQQRKLREQQEAAEAKPLVDKEDEEIQKILSSEVEPTIELHEFIAHSNVAPPAEDSIPAQVEAVYRDINSMIDTLGLNARAIKSFTQGHSAARDEEGRSMEDLEIADDWVLCETDDLEEVLSGELHADLDYARVQDLPEKLEACQELAKDMHRLRAKQEDLKRVILARMDPDQADVTRSLPLSAEQAAQQNELRREYTNFTTLLTDAEEALTLLKARIASASSASGKTAGTVPTVEAIIRTITKMTSMVERRSGDVDVLETQLRKMRLASASREGSPMMTPQARRSRMLSPDTTPSRTLRQSISSTGGLLFGQSVRATPPRKKLSGFSKEEKGDLMDKRARRQDVLQKLRGSVEKRGVNVWNMEDVE